MTNPYEKLVQTDVTSSGEARPEVPVVAAYLILSHKDTSQVERLIATIRNSSPHCHVFVSHDDRGSPPPAATDSRVHVRSHGAQTDWASWELVAQTLTAFSWVHRTVHPDLVVLISGQCYPARPLAAWEHEFISGGAGWLGTAAPLRYRPRWGRRRGVGHDDLIRYTYRWYRVPPAVERLLGPLNRFRAALALRLEPVFSVRKIGRGGGVYHGIRRIKTPFGPGHDCYKGWQWLAMDSGLLAYITEELRPTKPLYEYYRRSLVADESLIQTALSWRQPPQLSLPVSYCEWDTQGDTTLTWDIADLEKLRECGSPFVRKVDPIRSRDLLEALDEVVATSETKPGPALA